jgi:hypothetical protein
MDLPGAGRTVGDAVQVAAAYRALLEQLDGWFAGARERAGDIVPCRTGCTACCHGPFDTPTGRTIENACPIPEQFPGYAALAPAPFELEQFEQAEAMALADAAIELFGSAAYHDFETFIAAAVAGAR